MKDFGCFFIYSFSHKQVILKYVIIKSLEVIFAKQVGHGDQCCESFYYFLLGGGSKIT